MRLLQFAIRAAVLATLGVACAGCTGGSESRTPPNLLLLMLDTTRADHMSTYGYARQTTPNIDRLASEGLVFDNAISSCSWTLPAHASLFTGMFARDHHTTSENLTLDDSYNTLAELLRDSGYHTGGFTNNVWIVERRGMTQGFDTYREMFREQKARELGIETDDPTVDMGAGITNERILEWLDGLPDDDRPFFAFVNYFEPHLPFRPTVPFDTAFLPDGADPSIVSELRSFRSPREYGYILRVPGMEVSDEQLEILTGLYDGELAYLDSKVHELLEALRSRGLMDNTMVAIVSDHGENLGDNHLLDHKFAVNDPLIRVPLILHYPGVVPAGKRIASQVQAHDLFGTFVNLSGALDASVPALPFEEQPLELTFSELAFPRIFIKAIERNIPDVDTSPLARAMKAVRGTRYKMVWTSDEAARLYDLAEDPAETRDISSSRPEVAAEMRQALDAFNRGDLP